MRRLSMTLHPPEPVLSSDDEAFLQKLAAESSSGNGQAGAAEMELGEELNKRRGEAEAEQKAPAAALNETRRPSISGLVRTWTWVRTRSIYRKKDVTPPGKSSTNGRDEDMTEVLDRLNLAAVNNRAFSISNETQELLWKFKLVLKDLVNGVPTAYKDLEILLRNSDKQLQQTYSKLPGFLRKLIEKLPEKWMQGLAPEAVAAASELAGSSSGNDQATATAQGTKLKLPSLRELVEKPAAITAMLRSIKAFLKARFPAAMGMNVLWSLALFTLLFVLWYCYKRGREERLQTETNRLVPQEESRATNEPPREESGGDQIRPQPETETETDEVQPLASTLATMKGTDQSDNGLNKTTDNIHAAVPVPQRMRSRLARWSRTTRKPSTVKIEPYPGT
ncbi:hypothetical protein MPDQ_000792 [Monascus purpureus]|uniref:Uncharacterized protein n=1 Tax=Monascus purpureus TaxID=5098 RepID=A0A507QNZ1_MONPU|nr:hypothetical protein MPDQ_000792 [Monascus purpureus]